MHNLFVRSPKIMKLVLFASFGNVLSRRHICVYHLITLLQLSMYFMPHRVKNKHQVNDGESTTIGGVSVSLFTETEKLEATVLI